MAFVRDLPPERIERGLTYAGFVLVANELMASMIVRPIKSFYDRTTFHGGPFTTYEADVRSRHKNEFEACLLYLRDFMEALDDEDLEAIQALRRHRNDLAHDLVQQLATLEPLHYRDLWIRAERALDRLSQHLTTVEIGADPRLAHVNWSTVKGHHHLIFEAIVEKVGVLVAEGQEGGDATE